MGDYIVIYDPAKEIAAVVDADNRVGFGPAFIGPDAERALTEFLSSVDYDVTGVDSAVLRDWFEGWAGEHFQPTVSPAGKAVEGAVGPSGGNGVDAAALAEAEATAAGASPPDVQPSDTDVAADEGAQGAVNPTDTPADQRSDSNGADPPPYTGPCFACNGSGTIQLVDGEPPQMCSACRGSGRLPAPTP